MRLITIQKQALHEKNRAKYCQNPDKKGMWYETTWTAIVKAKLLQKQAEVKARFDAVYQEAKNIKDVITGCYRGAGRRYTSKMRERYILWEEAWKNTAMFTDIDKAYQENKLHPTNNNITTLKALLTEMKKRISKQFWLSGEETFHEEMNTHTKVYPLECGADGSK